MLLKRHMEERVAFALHHLGEETSWTNIIFSDEKKFNLDGPDGSAYYWRCIGEDEKFFSKRQGGGGSVMVWGGMSSAGKTELMICEGKVNSKKYCEILENALIPYLTEHHEETFTYQQDNAPIHTSNYTKDYLSSYEIET